MNISYKWLKELLDFNLSVNKVSDLLTDIGLEVEKVNDYEFPSTDLSKLLIGLVKESKKHPNADRLKATKVDVGGNEDLTIVCGAPNVSEGQKVVGAPVGTNLITSTNESFKINKYIDKDHCSFECVCSKGTYIRALGRDLGEAMNCFGHLYELRRTHIGNFSTKCAILLDLSEKLIHLSLIHI
mgnify:CR=1 FL=1